jgi:hypothetical protein
VKYAVPTLTKNVYPVGKVGAVGDALERLDTSPVTGL